MQRQNFLARLKRRLGAASGDSMKRTGKRSVAVAAATLLVASGSLLTVAAPAMAVGPVSELDVKVFSDGTAPFDAVEGPGFDTGNKNGIVRTQDTVVWELTSTTSAAGDSKYIMTLPTGMVWDAASAGAQVCTGPGGGTINAAKNVLTCNRSVTGTETSAIQVSAKVGSLGNGDSVALKVDVDGLSKTSDPVIVSATPKTEVAVYASNTFPGETFNDERGVRIRQRVYLGATKDSANPDFFGYEALQTPFTFTADVPSGAVHHSVSTNTAGGSISGSQPAGAGTPVTYTVSGANTNYFDVTTAAGMPITMAGKAYYNIDLFVPYEGNINPGQSVDLQVQVKGFDPVSLSGRSNFGDGYAPGQEPGASCAAPIGLSHLNCSVYRVTRSSNEVLGNTYGATLGSDTSKLIYGNWHGMSEHSGIQAEAVVPGQVFQSLNGVYNLGTGEASATNAHASITWDPELLQLIGAPELRLRENSASTASFYAVGAIGDAIPLSDYILEYTDFVFANDEDRKTRDSSADSEITWVGDPTQLAGGIKAVSSVRVTYLNPLEPGSSIGLITPMQRNLASAGLLTSTRLPWFWQYGSDATPTVKSNYSGAGYGGKGGNVQASDALVRAEVAWEKVSGESYAAGNAERGDLVDFKVTPIVIGPVGTATTVAKDTVVTVTMPNACLEPIASALPSTATLTPAAPGVDCTSGTPANIVFELGDLVAPGGDAGPAPYDGHATKLNAIQFPVKVALGAPAPATSKTVVTIDSSSDSSPLSYEDNASANATAKAQDKTYLPTLTVAGAAVFKSAKLASTANPGYAGPGEEMTYTVSFANASTQNFTSAQFVDLFPFEGDSRGSQGFNGTKMQLQSVEAAMENAAWGNVGIEYSSDSPATIQTQLTQTNNEAATSGVNWSATAPADLSTVTALRFTPENGIAIGQTGEASIKVKTPTLALNGEINNNVSMVLRGEASDIRTSAGASSPLKSSAVNINGTVWRDLNFDGEVSMGDAKWPATTNGIQLMSGENVIAKTDIAADGTYQFPLVASGLYQLAVVNADGWVRKIPATVQTEPGQTYNGIDVLYQEEIADPILVDATASIGAGSSALIDVTAGDTLAHPITAGSVGLAGSAAANTVVIASQPTEGSAQLELIPSGALSKITYTAPTTWPASQAGKASFVDSFTYSWTNVLGVTKSATVNVTVYAPILVDVTASQTIARDATATFTPTLITDSGLASATVSTAPGAGVATVDASGAVTFNATGVTPGTYTFEVSYTDNLGQITKQLYTVTVQAAPVATGGTATVALGGTHTFAKNVVSPDPAPTASVSTPADGVAAIDADGDIVYTAGSVAGAHTFTVTYTDNLGQTAVATYTVTVQDKLVVAGETSRVIGEGQQTEFVPAIQDASKLAGAAATVDPAAGTVTVDSATGKVGYSAGDAAPGVYTFDVTFTDTFGQETVVEYTVTVQAKPVASGDSRKVALNGKVNLTETVTTTGTIVDRKVTVKPAAGEAILGSVRYDAAGAKPGTYTFVVQYTDNVGQTAEAEFTVTVQAPPVSKGDIAETVKFGTESVAVDVLGAVTGTELQALTEASFTQPSSGTVALNEQGLLIYTPVIGFIGTVSFVTTVVDDLGQSVQVKTTITVEPDAPTISCESGEDCSGGPGGTGGPGGGSNGGGPGGPSGGSNGGGNAAGSGGGLAITGGSIALPLAAGIVMLGAGMLFFMRRKRREIEG